MFLEAALLGLIIGWLRGGTLKKLGQASFNGWPFALLGLAIQAAILADFHLGWHHLSALTPGLHILSYLPLLLFIYENINKPGMTLMGTGVLLNLVVIACNGGRMPVSLASLPDEAQQMLLRGTASPLHAAMTEETLLPVLGDIFKLPLFWSRSISIGDILMSAGIFILCQGLIKPKKAYRRLSQVD